MKTFPLVRAMVKPLQYHTPPKSPSLRAPAPSSPPRDASEPEHPPGWISSVVPAWISFLCFQPLPVSPGPSDSRVLASATPPESVSATNTLPAPWLPWPLRDR
ncbi:unnamed protein product [Bubo scandiacus]